MKNEIRVIIEADVNGQRTRTEFVGPAPVGSMVHVVAGGLAGEAVALMTTQRLTKGAPEELVEDRRGTA